VRRLVPTAKVVVLPQGVEAPPPAVRRPHARPYLLFLSRVAKKKGLDLLVRAFAALPRDLDLVIVGPDEHGHGAEVRATVAALGVSSRVVFAGPARGVAKSDWFAHAEAFVLPSDDENFGVVVIEAAHLGAPIVVSDQVGLAPAVVAHDAGVVCTRDVPSLVGAITHVLAHRDRYQRGTAALAAAFAWDSLVRRLEALYADLVP
jgi:glycosyltransferase involved in cell wall biosynthesis